MPRPLARFPLRSIAESLPHFQRRRIGDERLYHSQARTGSSGRNVLCNGAVSTAMDLQRRIVEALRLGKRGEASNLLLRLSQGNDLRGADDFVHVLDYCAASPDPLFVMEAWRIMNEKEISLNSPCSSLMVKALCEGGYLEEALNLIIYLKESHGCYMLPVYNTFLGACVQMQNMVYANQCLELMERQKVGKNEDTYAQLLKLAVWRKNLSVAHELWKDYIKHYSLSNMTLHKFVWSFGSLGDLKSACETLQYMVALVIRGKTSVTKSIERKLYSSRLDTPIPLNCELGLKKVNLEENEQSVPSRYCENLDGHVVSADRCTRSSLGFGETESVLVNGLSIHTSTLDRLFLAQSFNALIHACGKLRNGGLAEQLVQQRQKLGFHITRFACDSLIRAIVPDRGFSRGMEILKSMQLRNLKPYDRTLATLSISCCRALELDLAETLLDQISIHSHSHPHAFNAFLAAYDILDQPEHAVRMLAKMKHLQVTPNISTYEQLFSLFGNVNAPYEEGNMLSQVDAAKRIKAIEIDMASYGIQHSVLSMNNVLKALGAEGMMRELIHYLHVAEDLFCRNNMYLGTRIYNTALNSLVESEESQMAINIFKSMKSCGFRADAATYHIMIKYCKVLKCYRSACALVSMMLRDGFYPQIVTYTVLIDILLEDDSIHKALDLLDQASSEGNKLDILVFNTILRKAGEEGLIDVVEFLVGWMQQEKIQPDSTTCSAVFTAYTYCGFHSTAVEALQVLSMRMICDEDGSFPEKTQFEDDYIFAEDEGAESRIIKHFKDSEENLAFALLNLRWCAMLGFPISWLPDQSPWVKRLSTNYTSRIRAT
ncbi:PREDICTED: pentatricopeptide repeat-containing protein At1g76280 [Fragaria vesca subsp. vesca]|uniref:pentatricopeptide repeat-containing protein At1g76280 n=1 Tax=Fragaria vesca subsp. vesca TaxID=101020 RepID=UPI0002C2F45E|nr:PREDICTED: pentatricopeptide repeat-containing protein At1g76280 [Fragaria vesca subsp. vesca]